MLEQFQPTYPIPRRFETKRLMLRQFEMSDAEEYYDLEQEGLKQHMAQFMPGVPSDGLRTEGIREMREKIRTTIDRWETDNEYRFLIREKGKDAIIGQIAITSILRNVAQSAFIGYWIGNNWLNNGYATEATAAMLGFAFERLGLHRISIWIAPENVASLRVVEKLGIRFEGTALRALFQGGKWADTHIFAITSEEWTEKSNDIKKYYL
ncbi:MAG TPA: GNAT family protein [Candidatus Kapabacteria bacterium]|nr:GNAT family protein [Candidatus Kapabacteria bacterium]